MEKKRRENREFENKNRENTGNLKIKFEWGPWSEGKVGTRGVCVVVGGGVVLRVHVGRCGRVHLLGQRTRRTYPLTAVTIRSEAREHGK